MSSTIAMWLFVGIDFWMDCLNCDLGIYLISLPALTAFYMLAAVSQQPGPVFSTVLTPER